AIAHCGPAAPYALRHVRHLAGVRVFRYGDGPTGAGDDGERHSPCHAYGSVIHEDVARMSRVQELYLYACDFHMTDLLALALPKLRVLRVDHEMSYPFEVLAANPSLGNLPH